MIFITEFLNVKTLLGDHMGANVSLAKFNSRSNVNEMACNCLRAVLLVLDDQTRRTFVEFPIGQF